jgi:DNA-binding GntR family transcriptional regulator
MPKSSTLPRPSSVLAAIPKSAAPLRRQVLDELRQSIIAGRLNSGERLVERQLESEGLVAIVPNKGPIVRTLTVEEAHDIYAIRAVLEGLAARLFAEQADQAQITRLEHALSVVEKAYDSSDAESMLETKNNFYEVLFEGAKSETLSSMLAILHGRIWRWRGLGLTHPNRSAERDRQSLKNLRAVLQAVRARDAALAEKILRDEVSKAADEVHRLLKDGSPQAGVEKPTVS